jgi:simple sugar transport system permease protein
MSNGRGWISLAIIILVKGRPLGILLMSLLFGFFESVTFTLQNFNIPPQITSMLPYVITLVVLFLYSSNKREEKNE